MTVDLVREPTEPCAQGRPGAKIASPAILLPGIQVLCSGHECKCQQHDHITNTGRGETTGTRNGLTFVLPLSSSEADLGTPCRCVVPLQGGFPPIPRCKDKSPDKQMNTRRIQRHRNKGYFPLAEDRWEQKSQDCT